MGAITDLQGTIESRIGTLLGPTYSLLSNVTEVEKNSFKGANKRYGVVADDANQTTGTLKQLNLDQVFEVTLTDGYFSTVKADDIDKRVKTLVLQDLIQDIYKDLVSNKAGSPSIVIHTKNLVIDSPSFLEEDRVIVITFKFTIAHRTQL